MYVPQAGTLDSFSKLLTSKEFLRCAGLVHVRRGRSGRDSDGNRKWVL